MERGCLGCMHVKVNMYGIAYYLTYSLILTMVLHLNIQLPLNVKVKKYISYNSRPFFLLFKGLVPRVLLTNFRRNSNTEMVRPKRPSKKFNRKIVYKGKVSGTLS